MKKINYYHQDEKQSCGSYCIAMILDYYHRGDDITNIKKQARESHEGVRVDNLVKTLKNYNILAKAYLTDFEHLEQEATLPCIVMVENEEGNHYVVLFKIKRKTVLLGDPQFGKVVMTRERFGKIFHKVVVNIEHVGRCHSSNKSESLMGHLLQSFQYHWLANVKLAGTSLMIALITLAISYLFNRIFTTGENRETLLVFLTVLVVITTIKAIISLLRARIRITLEMEMKKRYLLDTATNLVYLDNYRYTSLKNGPTLAKLKNLESLGRVFVELQATLVFDLVLVVVMFGAIGLVSGWLLLGLIVMVGLVGYYLTGQVEPLRLLDGDLVNSQETLMEDQLELLENFHNIKQYRMNRFIKRKINYHFQRFLNEFEDKTELEAKLAVLVELVVSLMALILIGISGYVLDDHDNLVLVYLLFSFAINPVLNLINMTVNYQELKVIFAKYRQLVPPPPEKKRNFNEKIQSIEFHNVSFGYLNEPVLSNFSGQISKSTIITGAVGSGKTTLSKLICCELRPDSGEILFNGKSSSAYQEKSIRTKIKYLAKDPVFFNETLTYNLLLGCQEKEAECHELLCLFNQRDLLEYLDYPVNSGLLSAGMAQIVMLIRTLLSGVEVLILDEAISNVDAKTTAIILGYLKTQDFITVMITHHTNLVNFEDECAKIVVK